MKAKEKAKELVDKFTLFLGTGGDGTEFYVELLEAKQCALICVEEMIEVANAVGDSDDWPAMEYYEIRKEIENL